MSKSDILPDDLRRLVSLKSGRDTLPLSRATAYALALDAARPLADIDTPIRVRHFVAQLAHESGGFRSLVESLAYTDPVRLQQMFKNVQTVDHARRLIAAGPVALGSCIYALKLGNGPPPTEDGYTFRGRGFIMNTGRGNYHDVSRYTGVDLVAHPEMLGEPGCAANAAAAFWKLRHLNAPADEDRLDEITLIINGGRNGAPQRAAWLAEAVKIWR